MNSLEAVVLHSYWRSSCSWRVRIALELKGVRYTLQTLNLRLAAEEPVRREFRQVNPLGQVPVLECVWQGRSLRLSQSLAIIDFLEGALPEPALYPSPLAERAFAFEAAQIVNSAIQPFQNTGTLAVLEAEGVQSRVVARGFLARGLAALESKARERAGAFSVGDTVTLADVLLVPQLDVARRFEVALQDFPTLLAIETRCAALPAFLAAHPRSQPDCPVEERWPTAKVEV